MFSYTINSDIYWLPFSFSNLWHEHLSQPQTPARNFYVYTAEMLSSRLSHTFIFVYDVCTFVKKRVFISFFALRNNFRWNKKNGKIFFSLSQMFPQLIVELIHRFMMLKVLWMICNLCACVSVFAMCRNLKSSKAIKKNIKRMTWEINNAVNLARDRVSVISGSNDEYVFWAQISAPTTVAPKLHISFSYRFFEAQ